MDITPKLNRFPKARYGKSPIPVSPIGDAKVQKIPHPERPNRLSCLFQDPTPEETLRLAVQNARNRMEADLFNKRLKEFAALNKYTLRLEYFLVYCEEHVLTNMLLDVCWLLLGLCRVFFR